MSEAPALPPPRMTHEQFLLWVETQDETQKYELLDGVVVAMAPERIAHATMKEGALRLHPPGIEIGLDALFG